MNAPASWVVVDDFEVVRDGTRARLAAVDWVEVVGEAANGAEALQLVEELRPDIVLLDLRLPDADGIDAGVAGVVLKGLTGIAASACRAPSPYVDPFVPPQSVQPRETTVCGVVRNVNDR